MPKDVLKYSSIVAMSALAGIITGYSKGQSKKVVNPLADNYSVETLPQELPLLVSSPIVATEAPPELQTRFLALQQYLSTLPGNFSLYIRDNDSTVEFEYRADEKSYAASIFKLMVAVATLRKLETGDIKGTDEILYTKEDLEGGTGVIQLQPVDTYYTIDYLLNVLLKESDNVAQTLLTKIVGQNSVIAVSRGTFDVDNLSTPKKIASLLEDLYSGRLINSTSSARLFNIMKSTSFDDRISQGLDEDIEFSHKIGSWGETGSWADCGITFGNKTLVVCFMSENTDVESFWSGAREVGYFVSDLDKASY